MARRREFDVFSWAFLDVITSGFGAIVLMFVIINTQVHSRADQASKELKSETSLLEEEVLDGRKNLVRLRNALAARTEERDITRGQAERIREILARLRVELSRTEADSLARQASAEQLRSDIEQLEESNRRLAARAAEQEPGTGQKLRGFLGQGNRQYITGMKMGGSRVLVLVDASASMLARTYVNVVRFRNMPNEERRRAPKWQQTVKAVEWITTQVRPGTKVQIYTFNEQAHSVLPGTDGKWIEVQNGKELDPAIAALKKVVPDKGTSLINAFDALRALDPAPDSVFLLTDGLPTQGKNAPAEREDVRADRRATYFTQAERTLSRRIPFNILLFPMDGDPQAPGFFWDLAVYTGGALLTPSQDWP